MKIDIISSVNEAYSARGIAVVIDVFRAFSVEAYVFGHGADAIIPVRNLEDAHALKEQNPSYVLMGERGGIKPENFDFGNSPTEIFPVDFTGKTVIHTTSNGTKGLLNALHADVVLAGSVVLVGSTLSYIQQGNFEHVSLISTSDYENHMNEDMLLALYMRDILYGRDVSLSDLRQEIRATPSASFLCNEAGVPESDIDLCLDANAFDFVIKKVMHDNQIYLVREG